MAASLKVTTNDTTPTPIQGVDITVRRTDTGAIVHQGQTDASGEINFDTTAQIGLTLSVKASHADYTFDATGPDNNPVEYLVIDLIAAQIDFIATAVAKQCVRVFGSSWIWKVCWLAATNEISITFRHRGGQPHFTARYPGSTFAQYEDLKLAPSKGQHVRAYFVGRPYIPAALDP